jgi:hypothetical protein
MKARFGVDLTPIEAFDNKARAAAIEDANIVLQPAQQASNCSPLSNGNITLISK